MKTWITISLITLMCSISLADKKGKKERRGKADEEQQLTEKGLKESLLGEMGNLAKALRSLDQSYTFRGIRGCGSCTAGSVFVDWEAKGIEQPKRIRVLPPEPLILSSKRTDHCKTCGEYVPDCHCEHGHHKNAPNHSREHKWHHSHAPHRHGHDHRDGHGPCDSCSNADLSFCASCSKALVESAKKHDAFALNICVDPHEHHCKTFHPLASLGKDWSRSNLAVGQVGHDVRLRILTNKRDEFDSLYHEISLGELGCGNHRIAMEFDHGKLWICVNGSETAFLKLPGNLSNWK